MADMQRELAVNLLQAVAEKLEADFRHHRCCNTLLAGCAGDASQILNFDDLTPRFAALLRLVEDECFFRGVLTSTSLPSVVPQSMRELTPIDTAHAEHPIFTPDYGVSVIEKSCPELMPCIEGGFESVLLDADSDLTIEEVAMAQAILGRYEVALSTSEKLRERQPDGICLVLSIELYRHNRIEEAQAMHRRIDDGKLTDWFGVFLAIGICNRVPWCGYPFPDY